MFYNPELFPRTVNLPVTLKDGGITTQYNDDYHEVTD